MALGRRLVRVATVRIMTFDSAQDRDFGTCPFKKQRLQTTPQHSMLWCQGRYEILISDCLLFDL